ncbi:MAG: 3-hydroxyisobutyrate dehydrogenase family protein, partial [uncultured Thermomicrobiales bacterium]
GTDHRRRAQPRRHGALDRRRAARERPAGRHPPRWPQRALAGVGGAGRHGGHRRPQGTGARGRSSPLRPRAGEGAGGGSGRRARDPSHWRRPPLRRLQRDRPELGPRHRRHDPRRRRPLCRRRHCRAAAAAARHALLRLRPRGGGVRRAFGLRPRRPRHRRRDRPGLRLEDVLRRADQGAPGARHGAADRGPPDGARGDAPRRAAGEHPGRSRLAGAVGADDAAEGVPLGRRDGGDCHLLRRPRPNPEHPDRRRRRLPLRRRHADRHRVSGEPRPEPGPGRRRGGPSHRARRTGDGEV